MVICSQEELNYDRYRDLADLRYVKGEIILWQKILSGGIA